MKKEKEEDHKIIKTEKKDKTFIIYDITVNNRYMGTIKIEAVKPEKIKEEIAVRVIKLGIGPETKYKVMPFPFNEKTYFIKEKKRLETVLNEIPQKRLNTINDSIDFIELINKEFDILLEDDNLSTNNKLEFKKSYSSLKILIKELNKTLEEFSKYDDQVIEQLGNLLDELSKVSLEKLDNLNSKISEFYSYELTEIIKVSTKLNLLKTESSELKRRIIASIESSIRRKALEIKRSKEMEEFGMNKEEED